MDFAVIKVWGLRSRIIQIRLASHQPAFELLIAPHYIKDYICRVWISKTGNSPKLFLLCFWLHRSSKKWLREKMRCLLYNWALWCTNSLLCLLFDSCIIIFPFSFRPLRTSMAPTSASSHLPLLALPHFTADRIWDSSQRYSIMWKNECNGFPLRVGFLAVHSLHSLTCIRLSNINGLGSKGMSEDLFALNRNGKMGRIKYSTK